jgi:hypothetical protein
VQVTQIITKDFLVPGSVLAQFVGDLEDEDKDTEAEKEQVASEDQVDEPKVEQVGQEESDKKNAGDTKELEASEEPEPVVEHEELVDKAAGIEKEQ